ncbi:MAG: winged helix-turn-helix transcriptional regulator, partial [Pseudomonadota bacterium]
PLKNQDCVSASTKSKRSLEESGLVARQTFAEIPPRVEYSLTDVGRSLEPVLMSLKKWGEAYAVASH